MPIKTLTSDANASLFLDFLDPALSLIDLAIRHDLALDDLLDWSEHPDTRARLTRLHNLIIFRNSFLASCQLPAALTSLSAAAARTPDPSPDPALAQRTAESARRAAAQLARLATRSSPPSRATDSRATDYLARQIVGAPAATNPEPVTDSPLDVSPIIPELPSESDAHMDPPNDADSPWTTESNPTESHPADADLTESEPIGNDQLPHADSCIPELLTSLPLPAPLPRTLSARDPAMPLLAPGGTPSPRAAAHPDGWS